MIMYRRASVPTAFASRAAWLVMPVRLLRATQAAVLRLVRGVRIGRRGWYAVNLLLWVFFKRGTR